MTPKQFEARKKLILRFHEKWRWKMNLNRWTVKFDWHWDHAHTSDETMRTLMSVNADWPYLRATIHVYVTDLEGMSKNDIEEVLVHEMVHMVTDQMTNWRERNDAADHQNIERGTCELAAILIGMDRKTS
jgi:DNA-binding protein Fis